MNNLLSITLEEYLEFAREDGIEKGREEGKKEALKEAEEKNRLEKLEIARKMKEGGLSISQIKTFTGLSSCVIKKL